MTTGPYISNRDSKGWYMFNSDTNQYLKKDGRWESLNALDADNIAQDFLFATNEEARKTLKKWSKTQNRGNVIDLDQNLLDRFAAAFVTGFACGRSHTPVPNEMAKLAYDYAEAMLVERKRRMGGK